MNKEDCNRWVKENDSYPEGHSHLYVVVLYSEYEGVKGIHRILGPFEMKESARLWAADYKKKYTKPGFLCSSVIYPICEVL